MPTTSIKAPALVRLVGGTIRRHSLIAQGDRVLVAVSGGPDSVALLAVLAEVAPAWRVTVLAGHVNHGLRGAESDEDAEFVQGVCERLGVACAVERAPLGKGAGSLQQRARERRYAALEHIADGLGAAKIALGHTADDQAETLLMWMLRGAGMGGLAGIPPARDRRFIRPLLDAQRPDVLGYLQVRGLGFRTDSTNAKPVYLRNRIRHELLPVLRQFNPGIVEVLGRQAEILREEHLYVNRLAEEELARVSRPGPDRTRTLDREKVLALPVALQRRVVQAAMRAAATSVKNPGFAAVEAVRRRVIRGRSGTAIVAGGVRVEREYGHIHVGPASPLRPEGASPMEKDLAIPLPIPSETSWPATGQRVRVSWGEGAARGARPTDRVTLDPGTFTPELTLRAWRAGDRFQPQGMQGRHKKLQDFFADLKIPRGRRAHVPLLVAPEGILWVVGYRVDHRFSAVGTGRRLIAEVVDAPSPEEDS